MKYYTINNRVACTPFPVTSIQKETRNGMIIVKNKMGLQELTVVALTEGAYWSANTRHFPVGSKVMVRAEDCNHIWAKEVFTVDGYDFILVPEERILLKEDMSSDKPEPTRVPGPGKLRHSP